MVDDNLLETDRKRYADDVTVQDLVRLRVEIERLRERDKKLTKAVNAFLDEWDDGGPSCQTIRAIIEPEDSE